MKATRNLATCLLLLFLVYCANAESDNLKVNRASISIIPLAIFAVDPTYKLIGVQYERGLASQWSAILGVRALFPSVANGDLLIAHIEARRYFNSQLERLWMGPGIAFGYSNDENEKYSMLFPVSIGYLWQWEVLVLDLEGGIAPRADWIRSSGGDYDLKFKVGPSGNFSIGFAF